MASIEDRIAQGEEYKRKGNELFKLGKYKSAISKYGTVLAYIRGLPGSKRGLDGVAAMVNTSNGEQEVTPEQEQDTNELEKVTLQNIATCHMKLLNNRDALDFCNKAIKLDPKAWKAFMRRGEVYVQMGDPDNATLALNSAVSVCGDVPEAVDAINRVRTRVKALEKKFDQSQKHVYRKMFGGEKEEKKAGKE